MGITQPMDSVHLAECAMTFLVCEAHLFKIEVCLTWEISQKEQYTFETIRVG